MTPTPSAPTPPSAPVPPSVPTPWWEALTWALTGQRLDPPADDLPQDAVDAGAGLEAHLGGQGWDRDRLGEHVRVCRAQGRVWPHPLPDDLRGQVPAAQFLSLLGAVRRQWGLDHVAQARRGVVQVDRGHGSTLSAAERRLLAERPPHFGNL